MGQVSSISRAPESAQGEEMAQTDTIISMHISRAWRRREFIRRREQFASASSEIISTTMTQYASWSAAAFAIATCVHKVAELAELSASYGDLSAEEAGGMLEMWESVDGSIAEMMEMAADDADAPETDILWRKFFGEALVSTQLIGLALIKAMDSAADPEATINLFGRCTGGFPLPGAWRSQAC